MSLDTDNWETLQALFHLAEETVPEERERVLQARCSNPELVRRALEIVGGTVSLIEDAQRTGQELRSARVEPEAQSSISSADEKLVVDRMKCSELE